MAKQRAEPRFIIGIDLGTTQCALSFAEIADPGAGIRHFPIPQQVSGSEVEDLGTLPSLLFLPDDSAEFPDPPWGGAAVPIVGHLAHELGAEVPSRLIHSAKSWLCHPRVDRKAAILPWQSEVVSEKWSPVEVTAQYLRHLAAVWQYRMAGADPSADFFRQKIVITVPASFDPSARNLTLEAIRRAGMSDVALLEEPQAAFYDYLYRNTSRLKKELTGVKSVLVVDIGGGTTDFSLIALEKGKAGAEPAFSRMAVGPHLLIGGDNIDLAIARIVEERFRHRGKRLIPKQWLKVLRDARKAKETLFSGSAEEKLTFIVPGAGSKVISQTLKEEVPAEDIRRAVLDGFFPVVGADDRPEEEGQLGLSEAGLPYSRDPTITRHLAQFLGENQSRPEAILFNGGTTLAPVLRERILENLKAWRGDHPLRVLENPHPTLAVAHGAVYYGMAGLGLGISIKSGCPVSIYLGVGNETNAKTGAALPGQLLCLLPKGSASEEEYQIPDKLFGVDHSRDVAFYLFYANTPPAGEFPGFEAPKTMRRFRPLPPLTLSGSPEKTGTLQVRLGVMLRETGFLQIFCRDDHGRLVQELSFDVAPPGGKAEPEAGKKVPAGPGKRLLGQIRKTIDALFPGAAEVIPFPVAFKQLEEVIGSPRKDWDLPLLRALFDLIGEDERFHETPVALACFFRLAGFCLRPGFGAPGDGERLAGVWRLMAMEPAGADTAFWSDWWLLWKRVAAGLSAEQQAHLGERLESLLFPVRKAHQSPRKIDQHERSQIWRLLGHLELLPVEMKCRIGEAIFQQPATFGRDSVALYALGRLGSRQMLYADQTLVVPQKFANAWTERLLKYGHTQNSYLDWALKELGRKTGDRLTQIDDLLRKRVVDVLKKHNRKKEFIAPLLKVEVLRQEDLAESIGEQLPNGFVWVKDTGTMGEDSESVQEE